MGHHLPLGPWLLFQLSLGLHLELYQLQVPQESPVGHILEFLVGHQLSLELLTSGHHVELHQLLLLPLGSPVGRSQGSPGCPLVSPVEL